MVKKRCTFKNLKEIQKTWRKFPKIFWPPCKNTEYLHYFFAENISLCNKVEVVIKNSLKSLKRKFKGKVGIHAIFLKVKSSSSMEVKIYDVILF